MHCRARWHLDQGSALRFVEPRGILRSFFLGVLILMFMELGLGIGEGLRMFLRGIVGTIIEVLWF